MRARSRRGTRGSRRDGSGGSHPFLWGLLAGVVLVVTAGYFLLPPPPPPGLNTSESVPAPDAPVAAPTQGTAPVAQYDFYTILRDMEVKVPDWQLEPERTVDQKPEVVTEPGEYALQVGAFRRSADAERARADLALKGIRAAIQEVTINDNEKWFRVRVGPFADVETLRQARASLIEQGVAFIVIRDRKG